MLNVLKWHGMKVAELWFNTPDNFLPRHYLICRYQNMHTPFVSKEKEHILGIRNANTLVSDLQLTEEELMLRCESNVRNEIRRAKRDGVTCNIYSPQDLKKKKKKNDCLIRQFDNAYKQMHQQKNMSDVTVEQSMRSQADRGILYMTTASIDDEVVAYHVYIAGDKITRLLYSVSVYRDYEDNTKRNAIGRANRLLHYNDMLSFKEMGFITYDWGGYATSPELASINAFKSGFGGELGNQYFTITTSYLIVKLGYKILLVLKGKK